MVNHPSVTTPRPDTDPDEWTPTTLPRTGMTLDEARRRLSGLHFAKECLSEQEREVLYIAEGLLRLIDEQHPRGYAR